jgi:hypothetical protein
MVPVSLIRSLANIPKAASPNLDLNLAGVDKFNRASLKRALQLMTREGEDSAMGIGYGFGRFNPGTAISGPLAKDNLYGTRVLEPLRAAIKDKKADPYELALQSIRTGSFGEGTKKISSAQRRDLLNVLRRMERTKLSLTGPINMGEMPPLPRQADVERLIGDTVRGSSDLNSYYGRRFQSPALAKKMKEDFPYYSFNSALTTGRGNEIIDILSKGDSSQRQLANNLRPLVNIYNDKLKQIDNIYANSPYVSIGNFDVKPIREATSSMMNPSMKQYIENSIPKDVSRWEVEKVSNTLKNLYTKLPDSPKSRETALVLLRDENPNIFRISDDKIDEIVNMARLLEGGM